MKMVDATYRMGEGLVIENVTNLTTFAGHMDEADLTNAKAALMVIVKDNGDVQFLHQADEKLLLLGALAIVKATLAQDFIDVEGDEEMEDEDDDSEG